jgi:CRISPR/Cas system CSM-associated protein Csm3 (group 7 of RAMP superfamily)
MTTDTAYRTLFVGTLVQESFLTAGGTDDPFTTVDTPFCLDGNKLPTLRGSGLAGALIATLRHLESSIPPEISGSRDERGADGRVPSVWRFFNAHPINKPVPAYRQHVAIDPRTGAAREGALYDIETLPPGTRWAFLLEVDTRRLKEGADLARKVLAHWAAGRCLIGGEVARGLGWMTLDGLREYSLGIKRANLWPCSREARDYSGYIRRQFGDGVPVEAAQESLPRWDEYRYSIHIGLRDDGYGSDSLSVGGHASEEMEAQWDDRFLDRKHSVWNRGTFDPDCAVVTFERNGKRHPYIPGSSLRGPLRHAMTRLIKARGQNDLAIVDSIFGTVEHSAKLLIGDALPENVNDVRLAWMQHHAEDEFAGGAYGSAKFDRIAVMEGTFKFRMVLEGASDDERKAFEEVLALARAGQIGIGGGKWRGHGWVSWQEETSPQGRTH